MKTSEVCVLGDHTSMPVARSFAQGFDLKDVDVGFINSRKNMPNFGQLGCSGSARGAEPAPVTDSESKCVQLRLHEGCLRETRICSRASLR